jgi:hypothetical protein
MTNVSFMWRLGGILVEPRLLPIAISGRRHIIRNDSQHAG